MDELEDEDDDEDDELEDEDDDELEDEDDDEARDLKRPSHNCIAFEDPVCSDKTCD